MEMDLRLTGMVMGFRISGRVMVAVIILCVCERDGYCVEGDCKIILLYRAVSCVYTSFTTSKS